MNAVKNRHMPVLNGYVFKKNSSEIRKHKNTEKVSDSLKVNSQDKCSLSSDSLSSTSSQGDIKMNPQKSATKPPLIIKSAQDDSILEK